MDTKANYTEILEAIAAMTSANFDALASSGNTVIATGYIGDDFKIPELKNGWTLRLLPAGPGDYQRQLIIQPGSVRAKELWRKGQVALAIRAGLNPVQAEVWAGSRMSRRHELLTRLGEVVNDPALVTAYRDYNQKTDYREWSKRWGVKDGLSPSNRTFLVDQLNMVLAGEERANNPVNQKLKQAQEEAKRQTTLSPELQKLLNNTNNNASTKPEKAIHENKEKSVTESNSQAAPQDQGAATVIASETGGDNKAQEAPSVNMTTETVAEAAEPVVADVDVGQSHYE